MSKSALRKLQASKKSDKFNIFENISRECSSEEKSDDDMVENVPLEAKNKFGILFGDDVSDSTDVSEHNSEHSMEPDASSEKTITVVPHVSGARKKKKKRKKKNVGKSFEHNISDDIEETVKEVNAMLGEVKIFDTKHNAGEDKMAKNLLAIEHKHLNPQNEMKRIFGAKVVQANEATKRNRGRVSRGPSRTARGTWIIPGHSNWQQPKPGLSMNVVETTANYTVFKFQHSGTYQQAQFKFLQAVESLNHENILALLNVEPFHVDTLLQVSDIFRMGDDSAMAAQLIERAIYVMEFSTHPLFNLATGNSRLQYKQQENRSFFVAIFRHILNVGMKGCYRTALELCKLLLSLSPEDDPMAVSLMLDFYALRAEEYPWLVALYDHYDPLKNLSMLPNFSFSVPLALFQLSERDTSLKSKDKLYKSRNIYTCADMDSPKILRKRADTMLQKAIIMFPGVVRGLVDKCNINTGSNLIENHPFFSNKISSQGLSQITNLYVGRNYHVWKEPMVMAWLEENFQICLIRIVENDPLVAISEEKRKSRYQGAPTAVYRHIILSEIPDATAALPRSLTSQPILSFDPLPPPDTVCDYVHPKQILSDGTQSQQNILASFFRSLLPTYDVDANQPNDGEIRINIRRRRNEGNQQHQGQPEALEPPIIIDDDQGNALEGAIGGEPAPTGTDFRESVNTLLAAMRELLSNIHGSQDGESSSSESSEEGEREWD